VGGEFSVSRLIITHNVAVAFILFSTSTSEGIKIGKMCVYAWVMAFENFFSNVANILNFTPSPLPSPQPCQIKIPSKQRKMKNDTTALDKFYVLCLSKNCIDR
jgi:hypothetical protein